MKKIIITLIIAAFGFAIFLTGCNPPPKSNTDTSTPPSSNSNGGNTADTGPATYVKKGAEPEEHVKEYYENVIGGKLEEAYKMYPASNKAKLPKDKYLSMWGELKVTKYEITKVDKKDDLQTITAVLSIPGFGAGWQANWTFKKVDKGWIAESTASSQSQ